MREKTKIKICDSCGDEFKTWTMKQKHCSIFCYKSHLHRKANPFSEKQCIECDKTFMPTKRIDQLHCSEKCMRVKFSHSRYYKKLRNSNKQKAITMLGGKCSHCSENNPLVLQFHHLYDKDECVSRLLKLTNWNRIEKEVKKCILLCANCHLIVHYG